MAEIRKHECKPLINWGPDYSCSTANKEGYQSYQDARDNPGTDSESKSSDAAARMRTTAIRTR
jgi:hypothetical protein